MCWTASNDCPASTPSSARTESSSLAKAGTLQTPKSSRSRFVLTTKPSYHLWLLNRVAQQLTFLAYSRQKPFSLRSKSSHPKIRKQQNFCTHESTITKFPWLRSRNGPKMKSASFLRGSTAQGQPSQR